MDEKIASIMKQLESDMNEARKKSKTEEEEEVEPMVILPGRMYPNMADAIKHNPGIEQEFEEFERQRKITQAKKDKEDLEKARREARYKTFKRQEDKHAFGRRRSKRRSLKGSKRRSKRRSLKDSKRRSKRRSKGLKRSKRRSFKR